MRVVVLGAGAIGSLVGARLALAGHEVALVGRGPLVAAVNAEGIELKEPGRACRAGGVRASSTVADALAGPAFDLGVVSVKAYDTGSLIAELRQAGAAIPPLLTLQNGVGNEEQLAAAFGPERVIAGTIETPVSAPRPGAVTVHRGRYGVGLAPVGTGAPVTAAAAALRDAGFRVETFDDYQSLKWTKLLMNMLANAGAAILDWSPAQVMNSRTGRALEGRAWQEALRVMKRRQIEPVALNGYPLRAFAPVALRLPPGALGLLLSRFVSGGRGSKAPSLHLALSAGKRSEVGWLNGAVASAGRDAGVPAPVNHAYTELLLALTEGRVEASLYCGRPDRLQTFVGR